MKNSIGEKNIVAPGKKDKGNLSNIYMPMNMKIEMITMESIALAFFKDSIAQEWKGKIPRFTKAGINKSHHKYICFSSSRFGNKLFNSGTPLTPVFDNIYIIPVRNISAPNARVKKNLYDTSPLFLEILNIKNNVMIVKI
jgi:hypothetical protein